MTAKIIAVCNQKGGTGKTTVSMQLAGSLARAASAIEEVEALTSEVLTILNPAAGRRKGTSGWKG